MGKYNVKKTKTGFTFALVAGNHETIGTSEVYTTKTAALSGIKSVTKNAPIAKVEDQTKDGFVKEANPKFEIYNDKKGEFRFRLKAGNGQNILASEGYKSKASCLNGVESVKRNANSDIEEVE